MTRTNKRLTQFQNNLLPHQAYFISKPSDVTYLTEFPFLVPEEREALLLVTNTQNYLWHTSFTLHQADGIQLIPGCYPEKIAQTLPQIIRSQHISEVFFDPDTLTVAEYFVLKADPDLHLTPFSPDILWQQRMVKDSQEQQHLQKAGQVAAQTFEWIQANLRTGLTELAVKQRIEQHLLELGSSKPAFPTIVAFGAHTASPHHQPDLTILENNMPVLIDFGATVHHYRSDMTRSFWWGEDVDPDFVTIKNIVLEAYEKALAALNHHQAPSSLTAQLLDKITRDHIEQAGFGDSFIHTTGHGVGLEIHEQPSLSYRNKQPLQVGMAITIEPGIYLTDQFGFRYENTVILQPGQVTVVTL